MRGMSKAVRSRRDDRERRVAGHCHCRARVHTLLLRKSETSDDDRPLPASGQRAVAGQGWGDWKPLARLARGHQPSPDPSSCVFQLRLPLYHAACNKTFGRLFFIPQHLVSPFSPPPSPIHPSSTSSSPFPRLIPASLSPFPPSILIAATRSLITSPLTSVFPSWLIRDQEVVMAMTTTV
jgi:hypothetical protein